MVTIAVAGAVLLVCIGALVGAICTAQVLQPRLQQRADQQAAERHMLAKEWAAIHGQRHHCPHCTNPPSAGDESFASTVAQD
jgi:predicted nucleic acid-binding Zn ribbon protein